MPPDFPDIAVSSTISLWAKDVDIPVDVVSSLLCACQLCLFNFLGYRGTAHPPSDDEGTERTWFEPNNGLENAFLSNKSMASNPRKRHTNELNKIVIASTKAPGMTRPHSINTVKPDQNVHPREQCLGSTC